MSKPLPAVIQYGQMAFRACREEPVVKMSTTIAIVALYVVLPTTAPSGAAQESSDKAKSTLATKKEKLRADPCIDMKKDKKKSPEKKAKIVRPSKPAETNKH